MPNRPTPARPQAAKPRTTSRAARARPRPAAPLCDHLEPRQLLAAVSWDGGGGDNLWTNPLNWSNDVIPGATNDVTIDVAGTPTIRFTSAAGVRTIKSLRMRDNVTVEGGTLNVTSTGTVESGAVFRIQGGAISGGSWNATQGTFRMADGTINGVAVTGVGVVDETWASPTFSGATRFTSVSVVGDGASLEFSGTYLIEYPITFDGPGTNTHSITGGANVTITPSGSVRLLATSRGNLGFSNTTLTNRGLIENLASDRTVTIITSTFNNSGSLTATAGTVIVRPTTFVNQAGGSASVAAGATLNIGIVSVTNWSNAGVIAVNGGVLSLGGMWSTSAFNFAGFTRAGGTVRLTSGRITNTGQNLTLNSATGSWELDGPTIDGGQLSFADGQTLRFSNNGGTLADVQVNGELNVSTDFASVTIAGTTSFTTLRLAGSGSMVNFTGSYTLVAPLIAEGAGASTRTVSALGTLTIGAGGVIRLAAGAGGGLTLGFGTIINGGMIENLAQGRLLRISGSFNNAGSLVATAGTLTVSSAFANQAGGSASVTAGATLNFGEASGSSAATSWSNAGRIAVNGGVLNLGGNWRTSQFNFAGFTRTGGRVRLTDGTVTNTGQTLTLNSATGSWELASSQTTISGGQISFADGQTLLFSQSGGLLKDLQVNGDLIVAASSATLTISGTTTFSVLRLSGDGSSVTMLSAYTLSSQIVVEGEGATNRTITASGALTIAPGGVIRVVADVSSHVNVVGGTINNGGTIENLASGRTLSIYPGWFNNAGRLVATAGQVVVRQTTFANQAGGMASVAAGAMLDISATNWSNLGSITVNGGTLTLSGAWSTSAFNFAGFARNGGTVRLTGGMITNTGQNLTLNSATGSWELAGSFISGGQLTFTEGQTLLFSQDSGTLADVQVNSELVVAASFAAVIISGTTTFPVLRLSGDGSRVMLGSGYTLSSPIVAESTGSNTQWIDPFGTLNIGAGGAIRIAADAASNVNLFGGTINNGGTIENLAWSRTLSINATFNNTGILSATAGTVTVSGWTFANQSGGSVRVAEEATLNLRPTNLTNAGEIVVNDGSLTLSGAWSTSSFNFAGFTRTGGAVRLTGGTITNTGQNLTLNNATGLWELAGATISGGAITYAGSGRLGFTSSGGTLNNVTVNGTLDFNLDFASATIAGSTTFTGVNFNAAGGQLSLPSTYTLSVPVLVTNTSANAANSTLSGTTLTIAPGGVFRSLPGTVNSLSLSMATVVNNGLISAEATGRSLSMTGTTLTNTGVIQSLSGSATLSYSTYTNVSSGTLTGGTWRFRGSGLTMSNFPAVSTLAATVEFSGMPVPTAFNGLTTITAAGSYTVAGGSDQTIVPAGGTFTNNGTLETGLGSRITLTGNYVQTSTGTYRVQLAGGNPNTNYGSLAISGNAVVAGSFDGVAVNGYVPAGGQIQDVLTAANGQTGTFSSVNFPSVVNPEWQSAFLYTGVGVRIIHTSIIDFDLSGEVDLTDFFQFFNWFDATDINADLDNSGEVDLNDFFLFFNLWSVQ